VFTLRMEKLKQTTQEVIDECKKVKSEYEQQNRTDHVEYYKIIKQIEELNVKC
jgi:hypothetical protein